MIFIDQGMKNREKPKSFLDIEEDVNNLDLEATEEDDSSTRIYINTLSRFNDHRSGSYAMSSLKKITGTDSFLKQTDDQKNCMIQTSEDCQSKNFIYHVKKTCGCVPWALSSALGLKVCK